METVNFKIVENSEGLRAYRGDVYCTLPPSVEKTQESVRSFIADMIKKQAPDMPYEISFRDNFSGKDIF